MSSDYVPVTWVMITCRSVWSASAGYTGCEYHSVSSTNCRSSSTAVCMTWRRNISVTRTSTCSRQADISSRQRLRSSSTSALIVPPTRLSTVGDRAFPTAAVLLHASGTVCHFTSLHHHLYRLFEEEAEAIFVQPQFPSYLLFPITAATLFSP